MTIIHFGERIGRRGKLRIGCSAAIFDQSRTRILLTRRADNGQWCLPGGGMDPGESAEEACVREVLEETGLQVRVSRLVGVYSNRDQLAEYPDGNLAQMVVLHFETEVLGGEMRLSEETTKIDFFDIADIDRMDLMGHHTERIHDTLSNQPAAFLR